MTAEERTIPLGLDIGIFIPPAPETIYTARRETNAAFFRDILSLYVADGAAVTDLTWGLGNFWTLVDTRRWRLTRIDKYRPADIQADFCAVPLADGTQDVVIFDPPYVMPRSSAHRLCRSPGRLCIDVTYGGSKITTSCVPSASGTAQQSA